MAKNKSKSYRKTYQPTFRDRLLASKTVLPVIFVLVFGSIGLYYFNTSHAATNDCMPYEFYNSTYYQTHYQPCVYDIQGILNGVTTYMKTHSGLVKYQGTIIAQDGYFGPKTEGQVQVFQASPFFSKYAQGVDGIVGPHTWGALCYAAYYDVYVGNFGAGDYYDQAGCHSHNGSAQY